MPRRNDIRNILVIGAGPIVIGQACEFDYSGTQSCRILKKEGYRVVLINSNPATIMTDDETADVVYLEPINADFVKKIILKEKIDAVLPTMGGQTALNVAMDLHREGFFIKHNIELIGAKPEAIEKAEDRNLFNQTMSEIGVKVIRGKAVKSINDGLLWLEEVGLPAVLRPSFTLGGSGGGIAYSREEFIAMLASGLDISPVKEVMVDESIIGWKEYEMEVIRDKNDNTIIICSIENVDPMGIHTGDSITVAPALTLTDKEYQKMRSISIEVLRAIGVETGGSNVQFAVNPKNGEMLVIEMNPRVSRSSALASKATGFPIAKVATLLAVGYTLDEVTNEVANDIPASFEPTIDYVVTKIPRFAFEKFAIKDPKLTTKMQSIGEVMAVGRNFAESLQKAYNSLEEGYTGLDIPFDVVEYWLALGGAGAIDIIECKDKQHISASDSLKVQALVEYIKQQLKKPLPNRLLYLATALRLGIEVNDIVQITGIDRWFIEQVEKITDFELRLRKIKDLSKIDKYILLEAKKLGFSDRKIAELIEGLAYEDVSRLREEYSIYPVFKRVDAVAGEFKSSVNYFYSCYVGDGFNQPMCEANPSGKAKAIILGSGPNRIGQGIEFDYACVHAVMALRELGIETIMVNCNPETVSTDYDTADRLYFEPITEEHVLAIIRKEQQNGDFLGVMVQFGGQTPLKLVNALQKHNIKILGTQPASIDIAEDRDKFHKLVKKLGIKQPKGVYLIATDPRNTSHLQSIEFIRDGEKFITSPTLPLIDQLKEAISDLKFPLIVRPSYVLGGAKMQIVWNIEKLLDFWQSYGKNIYGKNVDILVDEFLQGAIEVDVDALADGEEVFVAGIMEHIEEAGIHSGDSACVIPPFSLGEEVLQKIHQYTKDLALGINVCGLINIQFAVKNQEVFVLEVNPRSSRTVPFVAKAVGIKVAKVAAMLAVGLKKLRDLNLSTENSRYKKQGLYAAKESVFPFAKFPEVDVILGPEMKSTGEVACFEKTFAKAFAKTQVAAGYQVPIGGKAFISVKEQDKNPDLLFIARILEEIGFVLYSTKGTASYLKSNGINTTAVNKAYEGGNHIVERLKNREIDLVINTTDSEKSMADSRSLRRECLAQNILYYTTISASKAIVLAIKDAKEKGGFEFDLFA